MNAQRSRLLIVDDEPQILKALKDLLEDEYEILDCQSGEEAIRLLEGGVATSVILSDQRMPGMAGEQFLARARQVSDATRVLMTGYADLKAVINAVNDGQIFGYISKPWDSDQLRLMVHRAFEYFRLTHDLSHEKALLGNLMEAIPDRIFFKDSQCRYIRANMPAARDFGLSSPGEIVGKTIKQLAPSSIAARVQQEDDAVLGSAKPLLDRIIELPQPDGTSKWISTTKAPVLDDSGKVTGLVGITRDVTERMRSEAALLESEKRYKSLYNRAPVMMCTTTAAGKIIAANGLWRRFAAMADDAGDLGSITDFMSAETREFYETEVVRRLQKKRHVTDIEAQFIDHGGRDAAVLASVIKDGEGEDAKLLWACVDVTEKRNLEKQLSHAQKMEAIGQLTGGVAHDFNNILGVIIGNLELLQDNPDKDDGFLAYARAAMGAAEKAADLIRRLLVFSRRQQLSPVSIDLGKAADSLLRMVERILGKEIDVRTKIGSHLWPVRVDQAQLESAILNLCINARDAMPNGGLLHIDIENVSLDEGYTDGYIEMAAGDYVSVVVSDTGIGMTPAVLEKAFEPFFTTKLIGKGTGLGLSMVYGFVKQSGGHATIYSEEGHGTSVKLYFPRETGGQKAAPQGGAEAGIVPGRGETILLAEDDDDVRATAIAALRKLGYNVLIARNGSEALEILGRTAKIDLLFTDVIMPGGMTGLELAKKALSLRPDLKVLYTSGYTDGAFESDQTGPEERNWLTKPYTRARLAAKIRQAIGE